MYLHFLEGKASAEVDVTSEKHFLYSHIFIAGFRHFLIYFVLLTEILSRTLPLYSEIAGP